MAPLLCQSQTFFPSEYTTRKEESGGGKVGLANGTGVCEGVAVNMFVGNGVDEENGVAIAGSVCNIGGDDCVEIFELAG